MTIGRKGRPLKGKASRDARIVICIEDKLKEALEQLAFDSRRTLSDYCHYVLEQHYWAVREEERANGALTSADFMSCNHANENPHNCDCAASCLCRSAHCSTKPSTGGRDYLTVS